MCNSRVSRNKDPYDNNHIFLLLYFHSTQNRANAISCPLKSQQFFEKYVSIFVFVFVFLVVCSIHSRVCRSQRKKIGLFWVFLKGRDGYIYICEYWAIDGAAWVGRLGAGAHVCYNFSWEKFWGSSSSRVCVCVGVLILCPCRCWCGCSSWCGC
jgi:hypothetical protein